MKKDIAGVSYHSLTAVKIIGKNKEGRSIWLCSCACGNDTKAYKNQLEAGHKKSCGCKIGDSKKTHGQRCDPLYAVWHSMISRCENKKNKHYKDYGGRGISVCKSWKSSPLNFIKDMGDKPVGLTLDRVNNDGNYSPENCRWATLKQQARNKRNTVFIELDGELKPISEWAEIKGVKRQTMYMRYKRGYSSYEIINGKQ